MNHVYPSLDGHSILHGMRDLSIRGEDWCFFLDMSESHFPILYSNLLKS